MSKIRNIAALKKIAQGFGFCFFMLLGLAFTSLSLISLNAQASSPTTQTTNLPIQENNLTTAEIDTLIAQSSAIRSSDSKQFNQNLALLSQQKARLSTAQHEDYLYLQAYKLAIEGNYAQSILINKKVENSKNINVRVRSLKTQLNLQFMLNNFDESNRLTDTLLTELINITNISLKNDSLQIISFYYNHIEEYQLALNYFHLIDESTLSNRSICYLQHNKLLSLLGLKKITADDSAISKLANFCYNNNEFIQGNSLLLEQARYLNQEQKYAKAVEVLTAQQAQILATTYTPHYLMLFSQLSRAYLGLNQLALASQYGEKALAQINADDKSKWALQTFKILAEIANQQGDFAQGVEYLQRYEKIQVSVNSIDQQKAFARAQIDHAYLNKVQFKEKLFEEKQQAEQKHNDAFSEMLGYISKFEAGRVLFAVQIFTILLLGAAILGIRHLQITENDKNRHDPLTNLFNRNRFIDLAATTVYQHKKWQVTLSLLVVNIDGFRGFNQKNGYDNGDKLLKLTTEILHNYVHQPEHIARSGAAEFSLLLPKLNAKQAVQIAENIHLEIAQLSNELHCQDETISASIGISDGELSEYSLKYLLCDSSKALRKAKAAGGNKTCCFEATMTDREKYKIEDNGLKYIFE
ncbi:diguanylate cyclase [Thalassotalea psychrophila]|uniref:diguanylate cyclase n=1 Tax=Thalassotalea psychrophila TaxID=3065647 RepID=A0ABY9TWK6_9GAMM|nr:diguanylate cyclase [Colwelliaceae bacterium SQ149]